MICLNCGVSFAGNYCPNCGQKAGVKRLSAHVLLEEAVHFISHIEKEFFKTTWNFLVHPGISSLNFLSGKRKKYQKPVSYFLIWTGLYILIHVIIINHFDYKFSAVNFTPSDLREQANLLLRTHFTIFLIPILFVVALFEYFILAKPRFNFTEMITLCLYGGGTYFAMLFISDIVLGAIFKINIITAGVFYWQSILSSIYNLWFSLDLFKRVHIRHLVLRLIAVAIVVPLAGWALMDYLPLIWIYFGK